MSWKDFATPTRIARVSSDDELLKFVNLYSNHTNVYTSLYWYDIVSTDEYDNEIRNAHIDKIFFDIDGDLESARKLSKYLLEKDLKFRMFHSGNGYHFYVFTEGKGNASNLRIAQLAILQESGASADLHIVGDVQRVSRVPNTWNFKSQSFCVPLSIEDLGTDRAKGVTQRFETIQYGHKLLDLSSFTEERFEYIKPEIMTDMKINTKIILIPCIKNIVKKINPTQIERYSLVVYLSNAIRNGKDLRGFDRITITDEIMKFFKDNCQHWLDWNPVKTMYQINNIVPKTNIICGCKFLKSKGVCIECLPGGI